MFQDQSWLETASFASYSCQRKSLRLKLWESPPCVVDEDEAEDERGDHASRAAARELLREMLAHGVSRCHPDPVAAVEAAKRKTEV